MNKAADKFADFTGLETGNVVTRVLNRFFAVARGRFYVFFIIVLIIWIVARHTVIALVYKVLKCVCFTICGRKEEDVFAEDEADQEELRSRDIFRDLELPYLGELLKKAEKELADFELNPTNSLACGDEHRYEQEPRFESTLILDRLQFRVQQIKKVIDDHLSAVHGRDKVNQFKDLSYLKKTEYLYKFAKVLNEKEERTRMDGITQSYNVDDSQLMKDTKPLKELLEQ